MREHSGCREPEDEREDERERRSEQEPLPYEPYGRERVRERRLEEHHCLDPSGTATSA